MRAWVLFGQKFLSIKWIILRSRRLMLGYITHELTNFYAASSRRGTASIFLHLAYLRILHRIVITLLEILRSRSSRVRAWYILLFVFSLTWSFITPLKPSVIHLDLWPTTLVIANNERFARGRWAHICTDSLPMHYLSLASKFCLFWIQNHRWRKVLYHLNLLFGHSNLLSWVHTLYLLLWVGVGRWLVPVGCSFAYGAWWSMLEELFIHLLSHLTILLGLYLFNMPIFVIH